MWRKKKKRKDKNVGERLFQKKKKRDRGDGAPRIRSRTTVGQTVLDQMAAHDPFGHKKKADGRIGSGAGACSNSDKKLPGEDRGPQ